MPDNELEINLTPKQIVAELDKYIIGQNAAKKSVAIALRNRWRRMRLKDDLKDEVLPKNIIMIGDTGVGKTEIARRMAKIVKAPFLKIEASKFTEVGYVGRDVESIVRDLTEVSVSLLKKEYTKNFEEPALEMAEERLLNLILPKSEDKDSKSNPSEATTEKFRKKLRDGKLDDKTVELEVTAQQQGGIVELIPLSFNDNNMDGNIRDMISSMMPKKSKRRKVKIKEAREILKVEEVHKLIDMDEMSTLAVKRVEQAGIIFLDEIDKIATRSSGQGPDVSREGVQRDLLPIVEGSTVSTKYGPVKTDHILFIAAGAFHVSKPSDLIPELQGRFPIRVELNSLSQNDFVRILTEPKNALTKQYHQLLLTEGVDLNFTKKAINELAKLACDINEKAENIGARRLHTILEKVLEEVSFEAPDLSGTEISITPKYIQERLGDLIEDSDLSRYIL